jgi:RimJ/RimL family protein N-acetyltransferase/predicted enzyme related to lactoylglutathione lyase
MELNQITLPVLDVEEAAAFYRRLGLVQIVASSPEYARFECPVGETTLSLERVSAPPAGAGAVVYLECDDLDGTVARLASEGVLFETEPCDRPWRWREARLQDPAGNRLCLFAAGENRRYPPWRLEQAARLSAPAPAGPFAPAPVVLEGEVVRLEPLTFAHAADLLEAGREEEIWRYMPRPMPATLADSESWIGEAMAACEAGRELPFAVARRRDGRALGSTRYLDVSIANRSLEIGWTWLGREARRTAVNSECKMLLLRHAFETLGAMRVSLKTDGRNVRSQRAIARLGAVREGLWRRHRLCWDGYVRDTVYFSVLDEEWPRVRARLERLLRRGGDSAGETQSAAAGEGRPDGGAG